MQTKARNEMIGQRFGRLRVIKYTNHKNKSSHYYWLCICDCGNYANIRGDHLRNGHSRSCGCLNTGFQMREKNPNWKGGRRKVHNYIALLKPHHPYADDMGYILEHRFFMEKKLGRYLRPEEVVHHVDGNPENNTPENLILFPNGGKHIAYHHKLDRIVEET